MIVINMKYLFVYFLVSLIFIVIFEIYALYKSIIEIRKRERSMNNIEADLQAAYKEGYEAGFKAKHRTEWIPVSERLPSNDEDVLVCYSQGGMEVCYYYIDDAFYPTEYADLNETGWFNENGDALYFEPIAWMPLPKPYEPQEMV